MRILVAIAGARSVEQSVFGYRLWQKAAADLRMLLPIAGAGSVEQSVLTDIQKNSGWKQLVLAFILFSCYPKR